MSHVLAIESKYKYINTYVVYSYKVPNKKGLHLLHVIQYFH